MSVLPLFPLDQVVFPGQRQALYIFEPRYRQLVQETRENGTPFGIALIREGQEVGGTATTHDIGCAVQLRHIEGLPDGRYNIICQGVQRFRVLEPLSADPYLRAEVEFLPEPQDANDEPVAGLSPAVAAQFRRYSALALALQDSWQREVPHPIRPVFLADYIAARLDVSTQVKQEVLGEPTAFRRLEFLLRVLQKENQSLAQRLLLHRRHKLHGLGAGN